MTSEIFYKFKSQREESRITFDGTGLSVFDLKKEIILAKDLGKANDFDLALFDNVSEQEYKDDHQIIPRSSSVIVKRLPAARPGKGKAAYYIASVIDSSSKQNPSNASGGTWKAGGTMSKRFDGKDDASKFRQPTVPSGPSSVITSSSAVQDEEAASLAAMFQATTEQWEETQEKMSQATKIYTQPRNTALGPRKPYTGQQGHYQQHMPSDRPTPPGYICYRCGQKGHWIQDCPTNNDREFDNRPRIKRTTGIPRSFLKAVEQPTDGVAPLQGVMVTPDGGYVVAQPDSAAWEKQRARPKTLTESDVREKPPTDSTLACPLCSKLFREAVKTPCCSTTYCEDCIQTHLLERDFTCPACDAKIGSLVKIVPNKDIRLLTKMYIDKAIEESKQQGEDAQSSEANRVLKTSQDQSPVNENPDLSNENEFFDQQPGGNIAQVMPDPASFVPNISQMQAELSQLTMMLNSNIPPQARNTVQMQAQQLSQQIQQAQMLIQLANSMSNAGSVGGGMMGAPPGQGFMNGGMMGMGQGVDGYNSRGYKKGEYRPGWTNPFPNQQPAGLESAYQRLPVNPRRRGPKRDRPSDFLEVGESRDAKVARYWE